MKNLLRIIVLIVMLFIAYMTISGGLKSLNRRREVPPSPEQQIAAELSAAPVGVPISDPQSAAPAAAATASDDLFSGLKSSSRIPFISTQQSKESEATLQTKPAYETTSDVPQLTTTLNYNGKWFAVINGNLVKAGDTIRNITIVEIDEGMVKIKYLGKERKLKL